VPKGNKVRCLSYGAVQVLAWPDHVRFIEIPLTLEAEISVIGRIVWVRILVAMNCKNLEI